MIKKVTFVYEPDESDKENASNGYLMSLIAIMIGVPIPITNLIATGIFYLAHRKGRLFTRWHCTQAMLSQIMLFFVNATTIGWGLFLLTSTSSISNYFVAYLIVAFFINLIEFILTIYSAVVIRKGVHVEWWFLGELTNHLLDMDNNTDHPQSNDASL